VCGIVCHVGYYAVRNLMHCGTAATCDVRAYDDDLACAGSHTSTHCSD